MRFVVGVVLCAVSGCAEKGNGSVLQAPELYPPVRAATPDQLVAGEGMAELGAPLLLSDAGSPIDASAPIVSSPADASTTLALAGDAQVSILTHDGDISDNDAALPPAGEPTDTSPGNSAPPPPGGTVPPPGGTAPPGGETAPPPPPGGTQEPSSDVPAAPEPPGASNPEAAPGAIGLSTAIQQRFYSGGPTDLLRIIKNVDQRLAELELDPAKHECLSESPVQSRFVLPGSETFDVQLQCLQHLGDGDGHWLAFGFESAEAEASGNFYFVEGSASGMGGAYRVDGVSGDIEGWIAVADKDALSNSQVIMHLLLHKATGSVELALAGSGVGFCSAHLKTTVERLFVSGSIGEPTSEGGAAAPNSAGCQASRSGCFNATALGTEHAADSDTCASVNEATFELATELDAAPAGNVLANTIFTYFDTMPEGVTAF
jgi:hypothetical protein